MIGVFDSGLGGLTVLKALMGHLPGESFVYLGDPQGFLMEQNPATRSENTLNRI